MVELLVVVAVVVVLAALLMPLMARSHVNSIRVRCVNNLKQVGLAFRIWQQDNGVYPMQYKTNDFDGPSYASDKQMFMYFQVISNELTNPKLVTCPEDFQRSAATNWDADFNSSHVGYFVGLNADDSGPSSLLAGDRNLATGTVPKNGVLEITTNQVSNLKNPAVHWTGEIHTNAGNILFADSHVEQLTSAKLRQALRDSGLATNRQVLP